MNTWNILYRGSLSSCNYSCDYCPFAKTTNTRSELLQDELELDRFVSWVAAQRRRIGILITPWGEALVHGYYRRAMTTLSRLPQVYRIALQTNLSAPVTDFAKAELNTLALWTTFHPSQTSLGRFLTRCHELDQAHIRYSVGVVGLREHFDVIEELRKLLRPEIYLWINAYKRTMDYYQSGEIDRMLEVDPYFCWNLNHYPSGGKQCRAGETTFTVDGSGDARRCHFLEDKIGNIYETDFAQSLTPRACTAITCSCHIGYIHRPALKLENLYGTGLLERIPFNWPEVNAGFIKGELPSER